MLSVPGALPQAARALPRRYGHTSIACSPSGIPDPDTTQPPGTDDAADGEGQRADDHAAFDGVAATHWPSSAMPGVCPSNPRVMHSACGLQAPHRPHAGTSPLQRRWCRGVRQA